MALRATQGARAVSGNAFVYPARGLVPRSIDRVVGCTLLQNVRRMVFARLPFTQLESDVEDVVYCTWVVDSAAVADLVPPGVCLIERDGKTLFTILTYRHRHFGPRLAGPLRRLFPSPFQSNWRLYVERFEGDTEHQPTVLFVKNIFSSPLYAIGSRISSDALPSHLAQAFEHTALDGRYHTRLTGGTGSAPDFSCEAVLTHDRQLPEPLLPFFDTWERALTILCLQDGALADVDGCDLLAHARIDLPIDIRAVQPLKAIASMNDDAFLAKIGVAGLPFCFTVARVKFAVLSEKLLASGARTE
jgi:hypothetical protein